MATFGTLRSSGPPISSNNSKPSGGGGGLASAKFTDYTADTIDIASTWKTNKSTMAHGSAQTVPVKFVERYSQSYDVKDQEVSNLNDVFYRSKVMSVGGRRARQSNSELVKVFARHLHTMDTSPWQP
jgi:hypothetical protein